MCCGGGLLLCLCFVVFCREPGFGGDAVRVQVTEGRDKGYKVIQNLARISVRRFVCCTSVKPHRSPQIRVA